MDDWEAVTGPQSRLAMVSGRKIDN